MQSTPGGLCLHYRLIAQENWVFVSNLKVLSGHRVSLGGSRVPFCAVSAVRGEVACFVWFEVAIGILEMAWTNDVSSSVSAGLPGRTICLSLENTRQAQSAAEAASLAEWMDARRWAAPQLARSPPPPSPSSTDSLFFPSVPTSDRVSLKLFLFLFANYLTILRSPLLAQKGLFLLLSLQHNTNLLPGSLPALKT